MGKTMDNLKVAFSGESMANRKYLAFSKKAADEGYPQTAKLFRAVCESENIHAMNHLMMLNGVKSTKDNIKSAIEGELYETRKMYPEFAKAAEKENMAPVAMNFKGAGAVEDGHEKLFNSALENLDKKEDIQKRAYFVCQVCGNIVLDFAPNACPVCGSPKDKFRQVE